MKPTQEDGPEYEEKMFWARMGDFKFWLMTNSEPEPELLDKFYVIRVKPSPPKEWNGGAGYGAKIQVMELGVMPLSLVLQLFLLRGITQEICLLLDIILAEKFFRNQAYHILRPYRSRSWGHPGSGMFDKIRCEHNFRLFLSNIWISWTYTTIFSSSIFECNCRVEF